MIERFDFIFFLFFFSFDLFYLFYFSFKSHQSDLVWNKNRTSSKRTTTGMIGLHDDPTSMMAMLDGSPFVLVGSRIKPGRV